MNQIMNYLLIGSEDEAEMAIKFQNIDVVIDLRSENVDKRKSEQNLCALKLIDYHSCPFNINGNVSHISFNIVTQLMRYCILTHKKIYMYCDTGMDRSCMVTCTYLMRYHNMTASDSVDFMMAKRPMFMFEPNRSVWESLCDYGKELYGESISFEEKFK